MLAFGARVKYSFVIPIYNDGALAEDMCKEFERVFKEYVGKEDILGEAEIVFVDDGSKNDSVALVKKACDAHPFASLVTLSRNFGQHIAITCGYEHAKGDYVGMLNVDQEDPPDQLPVLLDAIQSKEDDYDIVGGMYPRRDVPLFSKVTSYLFHLFLNRLTGYNTPTNASTARVMNRRFLTAYNSLNERNRYIPGLEKWLGFRYGYVPVRHQPRRSGRSSYNFRRRLRMATDSIISFSDFPLRLAVKVGMWVAFGGLALALLLIADKLFFTATLPGFVSTIAVIVILGGAQISVTGLVSLYVGRILAEVQGRPLYIVRERYGQLEDKPTHGGASGQAGRPPLPSAAV